MAELQARFQEAADLQRRGRYAEAVAAWQALLAEQPDLPNARENLALALLGAGDYAAGFPLYDLRFSRSGGRVAKPNLTFPEWRGEPLAGKSILIWMEQGFGDQIMFARFAGELARQDAEVSILAPPALTALFSALPGRVIAATGQVKIPRHDYWVMPGSIPGRLGTTLESLPAAPYLAGGAGGAGVGFAWRGDPRHPADVTRSMPKAFAAEILALPGVVSLDPDDTGAKDFQTTAAIMQGLERVVSVDTSAAHLAGAMGLPVWVLLPAEPCDWRWMSDRTDSPWYPSAELIRQPTPGDWRSVVDEVKRRLQP